MGGDCVAWIYQAMNRGNPVGREFGLDHESA